MPSNLLKHIYGRKSVYGGNSNLEFITIGRVVSIDDEGDAGRIVVNINSVDARYDKVGNTSEESLAFPLLPKHLQVIPKVGESVFVLKLDLNDTDYINRYWIGPIISQPQKLNKDPHFFSSQAALPSGVVDLEQSPKFNKEADGVFPDKSYIAIQGRNNSDLTFKNNEVVMRAGQHMLNNPLKFNTKNMGFFQIKYNNNIKLKEGGVTKEANVTVANIVADKINFLTHSGTKNFNLRDRDELINNESLTDILNNGHPLPYGDILLEFIKATKAYILNHVHPYHGMKPVAERYIADNFINFDLNRINCKNIKID